MKNETDILLQEQYLKLPKALRGAIASVPWNEIVKKISSENSLSSEQATSLETEVQLVIYGFENPRDLIDNLEENLKVQTEVALTLAEKINELIFSEISRKAEETSPPETKEENFPLVEEGEKPHDVKPISEMEKAEIAKKSAERMPIGPMAASMVVPKPDEVLQKPRNEAYIPSKSDYPGGKDPYREPFE